MAHEVPRYPVELVIILAVVVPLLSLCFLIYAISVFLHNPINASLETNARVLGMMIASAVFAFIGYLSFAIGHDMQTRAKDKIKQAKYENSLPKPPSREQLVSESNARARARDDVTRRAEGAGRREALTREARVEKLRQELIALKGTMPLSVDDSDLQDESE